ncbi:GNAT family N-acetyltransferase [Clostridium sp. MCC353]|uniref:GNAT family N-acetyltransferase n=1 Tax=Clostridium sp. MCC353 TaxID=2592646 RepID=UPI001C032829|nr:GNAT family N-acetyltransferase [Clostridium sp. MCC353]MBT9778022.1 GNAT family N-acetyltransferase [Clostridium sp. MCC353]
MKKILETDRLILREMEQTDYEALCRMLQDREVMYAYEHSFSDEEAHQWLERQIQRYREFGYGLWAVVLKVENRMVGQCGITRQDCDGKQVLEVGYLFEKAYWHRGYATEAAIACKEYAFDQLGADEVYSIIRDNNVASQKVAERNGMECRGMFVKHYYNMDMPHLIFSVKQKAVQD